MEWWSSSALVRTRDLGVELEQRAVGLVGLDHDPLAAPPAGVRSGGAQLAADDVGRVEPAAAQRVDDHRRGRRLAVGPGDGQAAAQRGDLGEQVGAVQLAAAAPPGARDCRPGPRSSTRPRRRRGRSRRAWPIDRLDPVLAQPLGVARTRPRSDPVTVRAERVRDQRQPAHAGAADADEVQPARGPVRRPGSSPWPASRAATAGPRHSSRSSTTTGISRAVLRWYSS